MKELIDDLKTGQFRHVYLLYGEEPYLMLQYRDRLVKALLPDDNGMNLTLYGKEGFTESAVIDQAETLPFFAERRVLRLDDTGLFKAGADLLPDYLKQIPDYCYLIFTEHEVDKRSRMFKSVKANGRCVEFGVQTEDTLKRWILTMLAKQHLRIRPSVMDYLLEKTGNDMNHIRLEVDKLANYCRGNPDLISGPAGEIPDIEVTKEDVDAVVSDRLENRIFDMISAITSHNRRRAMDLYADLLALKTPPIQILVLIGREFNRLLIVKELSEKGYSDSQIAQKAGMPPFAVRRSRAVARNYTHAQLEDALRFCNGCDADIKSGNLNDRMAVELVLLHLS